MQWTARVITRLHELHNRYVAQLRADVLAVNRLLGSAVASQLQPLGRAEFERLLTGSARDPEARRLWVQRILRGHEGELPRIEKYVDAGTWDRGPAPQPGRRQTGS